MAKAAVVILADTDTHADLGRLVNALQAAREFKEAGDEVKILFDGAGTKWIGELSKPDHRLSGLFQSLKGSVYGACSFCATAFGAKEAVVKSGVALLDENAGHPSLRKLIADGYHVLTF